MTAPPVPDQGTVGFKLFNFGVRGHTLAYRLSGGRIGKTVGGAPVFLLDHVGAKSGKKRTTPLLYLADGDDVVIVASRGGSPKNPAWFHNLLANPETDILVGSEKRHVRAHKLDSAERSAVWPQLVELFPDYDAYQARADREIPVMRLRRV